MVRQLLCDKCKQIIKPKTDYIKLQKIIHKDKHLIYIGVGHLCLKDFEEIVGRNKNIKELNN